MCLIQGGRKGVSLWGRDLSFILTIDITADRQPISCHSSSQHGILQVAKSSNNVPTELNIPA